MHILGLGSIFLRVTLGRFFNDDQQTIFPNWTIGADIPTTQASFGVSIQIWDHDSTSGDDLGDASPVPGKNNLDLLSPFCASSRAMGFDGGAVDHHEGGGRRIRQAPRKSSATALVCSSDCTG